MGGAVSWSGHAARLDRARAAANRSRGFVGAPKCKTRRALDALLPGRSYVVTAAHRNLAHAASVGGKRFTTRMLPCGKVLVTRVA